jgi:pSer/pThr/pTyr-binding forkhead associated (FHA) protein
VVINHAVVSRRHALLEQRGRNWLLSDCDSTNGLWWQGRRVQQLLLRCTKRYLLLLPQLHNHKYLHYRNHGQ